MKWDKIKIYLIILLVVVNGFFAVTLFLQYRSTNYIPNSELDQLSGLLSGGPVEVPDGTLPAKKQDSTVYGGAYSKAYYETAADLLSGGSNFSSYVTLNGMNFVMRDSNDTYEFTYPFGFTYVYRGNQDSDYALDISPEYMAALPKVDIIRAFYTLGTIKKFLYANGALNGSDTSGGLRIKLKTDAVYFDSSLNCYITEVVQYAGSQPIYGCSAVIAVNGNQVVYVSGNLILCNLDESYNTELRDQVNLMLFENRELSQSQTGEEAVETESGSETAETEVGSETAADSGGSADTAVDTAGIPGADAAESSVEKYVLTSAENCLCITWNSDRSKFYLLPGWKFTYNNSVVRIRNAVNGSIYTK